MEEKNNRIKTNETMTLKHWTWGSIRMWPLRRDRWRKAHKWFHSWSDHSTEGGNQAEQKISTRWGCRTMKRRLQSLEFSPDTRVKNAEQKNLLSTLCAVYEHFSWVLKSRCIHEGESPGPGNKTRDHKGFEGNSVLLSMNGKPSHKGIKSNT